MAIDAILRSAADDMRFTSLYTFDLSAHVAHVAHGHLSSYVVDTVGPRAITQNRDACAVELMHSVAKAQACQRISSCTKKWSMDTSNDPASPNH